METLNLIDLYELQDFEDQEEQTRQGFHIGNLEECNWALRKMKALTKKQDEVNDLAEKEIQRITDWKQKEEQKKNRDCEFFEFLLGEYLHQGRQMDAKFKISTPYGTVGTRKQQPKWEILKPDELIAWLKKTNKMELIRTKEEPNLAEIKKTLEISGRYVSDADGELAPGIKITEQPEKVIIKIS